MKSHAFTLIEILLVIVILSVILATAVPNFARGFGRFELEQTAQDIKNKSRWAQAMAMQQHRAYALSFIKDKHAYQITRALVDDEGTVGKFEQFSGVIGKMQVLPKSIDAHTEKDAVLFLPDATIEPATIELTSGAQKIVLSSAVVRGMLVVVDE
jgi:prepilin-type N-terminal cleavage/methylation domain-containing protein